MQHFLESWLHNFRVHCKSTDDDEKEGKEVELELYMLAFVATEMKMRPARNEREYEVSFVLNPRPFYLNTDYRPMDASLHSMRNVKHLSFDGFLRQFSRDENKLRLENQTYLVPRPLLARLALAMRIGLVEDILAWHAHEWGLEHGREGHTPRFQVRGALCACRR